MAALSFGRRMSLRGENRRFGVWGQEEERLNTDEHRWIQMNTDIAERRAVAERISPVLDDAPDLDARRAEVDQQAERFAGGTQVVDALRAVRAVERSHGLQFDEDGIRDQQIDEVFADNGGLVADGDRSLLFDAKTRGTQFQCQRNFEYLFQKPTVQRVGHREREADDPLGYCVPLGPIRGHLCPSVFICVESFFLEMLPADSYQPVDARDALELVADLRCRADSQAAFRAGRPTECLGWSNAVCGGAVPLTEEVVKYLVCPPGLSRCEC